MFDTYFTIRRPLVTALTLTLAASTAIGLAGPRPAQAQTRYDYLGT